MLSSKNSSDLSWNAYLCWTPYIDMICGVNGMSLTATEFLPCLNTKGKNLSENAKQTIHPPVRHTDAPHRL